MRCRKQPLTKWWLPSGTNSDRIDGRVCHSDEHKHQFNSVAELIAEDAVYWFNDGSFIGREAIRDAFEATWAYIRNETYQIEDVKWLTQDAHSAVCIYTFRWQGQVNERLVQGSGRGTSVLRKVDESWRVVHEHLSPMP